MLVKDTQLSREQLTDLALDRLRAIVPPEGNIQVIIVTGRDGGAADSDPVISQSRLANAGMPRKFKSSSAALTTALGTPLASRGTRSMRSTRTNLRTIQKPLQHMRATKIICTLGPACWTEDGMRALVDAGCDIVRLNFSHGSHAGKFASRPCPAAPFQRML